MNCILCQNTLNTTQVPLAPGKIISVLDLHQTHLCIGTSPQNLLISVSSNAELIDVCYIANCHYRSKQYFYKNGEKNFFEIFSNMGIIN